MAEYFEAIKTVLKKHSIEIGHRISVEKDGEIYEGILMPNTGDPDVLVIKLDNGYNVGLAVDNVRIKKIDAIKPKALTTKKKETIKFDRSKPLVCLITTGGTITSKVDYNTGGVISLMTAEEFVKKTPEIANIANIEIVQPFTKMSEDMEPADWASLSQEIAKQLNRGAVGAIVAHGTDTLHYTAAALSFMLETSKPVILVGAQRSSDRGSTDSAMNLICAVHLAVSDIAEVGTCMHATMNDDYCLFIRGTKVRKMHASRRDAFRPINDLPLAKVYPTGNIEVLNENYKKRENKKAEADAKFEEKIALQKIYPGSDPEILEYLASKYKGIVLEATGFGHIPTASKKSWIPAIKKVSARIPVVVATQTIYGRVNTNVYTNLRILFSETNAIPAEDMHPETAFVKLGFVLGHTKKLEEVRKLMLTNLAGEISSREGDAFLI
ncbi:MAG: Glu-tRNA(Gln) amidotransferase subunit GatD [Candidatus Aenigmarchaeota archaeon]|nr:Glu-tRNA(Gln) amidotransferase subunit GatD [Candidatus Aenigmarchaeota archaeon]